MKIFLAAILGFFIARTLSFLIPRGFEFSLDGGWLIVGAFAAGYVSQSWGAGLLTGMVVATINIAMLIAIGAPSGLIYLTNTPLLLAILSCLFDVLIGFLAGCGGSSFRLHLQQRSAIDRQ